LGLELSHVRVKENCSASNQVWNVFQTLVVLISLWIAKINTFCRYKRLFGTVTVVYATYIL